MVLFVSKLISSQSDQFFVELSDGWYPIKASFDSYLAGYFNKNKIKIGDKLAIFSAELINCPKDGCPPLEAPQELYLKLSVNSTRKAKWFAKLGFLKHQRPLAVRIDTIKPNSNVGAIDVLVERVYPILYYEKMPDGNKVYRNEKQEENYNLSKMIASSENDHDRSDSNKSQQTSKQMPRRNVNQILKLRLSDYKKKPNTKGTCIITIWQNATELKEKIQEGQRLSIFNLNSIPLKYDLFNYLHLPCEQF
jgi:hypothetical protein